MAIVIPDLFGAFQKGREYAIDRNWKDLQNYEAIEKARNENDLGALNLLERRVMFAPKMGMYMDNADMSARNNALGGAAFPGLMAKTQAQSALDTAKANVDIGLIPTTMKAYEESAKTSAGTALTESAIKNAANAESMKNAKTLGELAAQTRLYGEKYGAENARQAFDNAVKMNTLFQENFKVALREAKFRNSQKGLEIEQMMQQGRWEEAKNALLELGIRVEDTAYQAKKSPEQRAAENNPTTEVKPTLSPEQINYAMERILTGTNTVGQPLTEGEINLYTTQLNTEAAANHIKSVYAGNPTVYYDLMARAGRLYGASLTNNNSGSNKVLVPQNPNNAGNNPAGNNPAGNNPAGNNPAVRYDPMTGERIVQLVPYSQAVNNSAGNFYIRGDNTFTPYPYNMTIRPLSGDSLVGWSQEDIQRQNALQRALMNAGYNSANYPAGISLFDLSIRDPQNRILIPANQKAYYQQFGW